MPTRRTTLGLAAATLGSALLAPTAGTAHAARDLVQVPADAGDPHFAKHDFRGLWIASVANVDWPTKPGLSAEAQQAELVGLLDLAVARGLNAIILQVRPTADTFWRSDLEPWSHWLTGTQGTDPGYDPLGFAVEQAHARGLELHAWFNPFRVDMNEAGTNLSPEHPARKHPEWVLPYGGKLYYNPGLPEVRRFSESVILEAVSRYDIDAVHFDDYFYPYPVAGKVFDDAAAYAQYGNGLSLADWRRANIDDLIVSLGTGIKKLKPWVQFGISPFGVWRNQATDPAGSATTAGVQTYDDLYADTRKWVQEHWVDYMLPQVYWSKTMAAASYVAVSNWWAELCRASRVHLYLGEAVYKVEANFDKAWYDPRELVSHLEFREAELSDVVKGNVYYNATSVKANKLDAMGIVAGEWYGKPALTPVMEWIDGTAPSPVHGVSRLDGTLRWQADPDAAQFIVYRVPKKPKAVVSADLADMTYAVAVLPGTARTWTDTEVTSGYGHWTYLVTAVDRGSNESSATIVR